jgi:hypothetical protein
MPVNSRQAKIAAIGCNNRMDPKPRDPPALQRTSGARVLPPHDRKESFLFGGLSPPNKEYPLCVLCAFAVKILFRTRMILMARARLEGKNAEQERLEYKSRKGKISKNKSEPLDSPA